MRNLLAQCCVLIASAGIITANAATTDKQTATTKSAVKTAVTKIVPPATCTTLKLKSVNKNVVLEGNGASEIYFLKNHTQKSIWIDHPNKHLGTANAGWSSYLTPGHSSAILIDKKDFALSCEVIHPGKVDYLDCAQALTICKPQHVTYTTARKGSFWLVEDKPADEMQKDLTKRGIK
jgi:hypothetical protein